MASRKPAVQMRNIVVELPEDIMLRLVKRAKESSVPAHSLAANVLLEWLK